MLKFLKLPRALRVTWCCTCGFVNKKLGLCQAGCGRMRLEPYQEEALETQLPIKKSKINWLFLFHWFIYAAIIAYTFIHWIHFKN